MTIIKNAQMAWQDAEAEAAVARAFTNGFIKANEISRIRSKVYRGDAIIASAEADKAYRKAKDEANKAYANWERLVGEGLERELYT